MIHNNISLQSIMHKLIANFHTTISGFHHISNEPLKEARWEDINGEILESSGCKIMNKSCGSHKSGCDIESNIGKLSNKTTIIKNNMLAISSYRLTTVCNNKSSGNMDDIVNKIEHRNSNFDYYSILVREEFKKDDVIVKIKYIWYLVPKTLNVLKCNNYKWCPNIDSNNNVIGWKTNKYNGCHMRICFSMSSQLWIYLNDSSIEQYKITETIININNKTKIKYYDLHNIHNDNFMRFNENYVMIDDLDI